jgi:hypothetical protein
MAEIAASVIGIVAFGTRLSISIFDFASGIGGAGRELQLVGTEVSLFCSVLTELQTLLDNAHFDASTSAIQSVNTIISQCQTIFTELERILDGFNKSKGNGFIPSPTFVNKVKLTFKQTQVLLLRQTLESCKLTLSVMLFVMHLAEQMSQRRRKLGNTLDEDERVKVMTQSLVISQQCAVEQLEHYEDEVEKEQEDEMLLPNSNAANHTTDRRRRRSRGRLAKMFSGISLVTDLPSPGAVL